MRNENDYDEVTQQSFKKYDTALSDEKYQQIEDALAEDNDLADEYFNVMANMALWIFHLGNYQKENTLVNESYCKALAEKIQKNWANWHPITQEMCRDYLKASDFDLDDVFKVPVSDEKEKKEIQDEVFQNSWFEYLNSLSVKEAKELDEYYVANKDFQKEVQKMYVTVTEMMAFSILQIEWPDAKKEFHLLYDSFLRDWNMSDKATRGLAVFFINNPLVEEAMIINTSMEPDVVCQSLDNLRQRIVKDLGNVLNLKPKLKIV